MELAQQGLLFFWVPFFYIISEYIKMVFLKQWSLLSPLVRDAAEFVFLDLLFLYLVLGRLLAVGLPRHFFSWEHLNISILDR